MITFNSGLLSKSSYPEDDPYPLIRNALARLVKILVAS
jgi:hypothetical protein